MKWHLFIAKHSSTISQILPDELCWVFLLRLGSWVWYELMILRWVLLLNLSNQCLSWSFKFKSPTVKLIGCQPQEIYICTHNALCKIVVFLVSTTIHQWIMFLNEVHDAWDWKRCWNGVFFLRFGSYFYYNLVISGWVLLLNVSNHWISWFGKFKFPTASS